LRLKLLLVGEESAGIQTLKALARTEHCIVGVMASSSRSASSGATLWRVAQELGYATWPAKLVKDPAFASEVRSQAIDMLLNVHSLFVINRDLLEAARIGAFNMHPGPLPEYAGLNVVSWALYRGERTHGVTIHKMLPEIDTGPIVYQSRFAVEDGDTALSVYSKCMKAGVPLMLDLVKTAAVDPGAIPLATQDLTKREYFGKEVPEQGRLSWASTARQIVNFVRACNYFPFPSPWGHPKARMDKSEIAVVEASRTGEKCDVLPGSVGEVVDSAIRVACGDEWISVGRLMVEGKYLRAIDLLKPGDHLEDGR